MTRIDAPGLKALIHGPGELALLDVREAGQFGEAHLLFAVPLPYSRLELDAPRLVPRRSTPVVVCDDGTHTIADRAARRLEGLGYTDVRVLEGGTRAWRDAGYSLFGGVNVPSKLFGELVEHAYGTPHITAQELLALREAGVDHVVIDGRPYAEFQRMSIPGAISCPNGELAYRIRDIVTKPDTRIVVNCAGRTRSIIGAQTLRNLGIPNPVWALENGTPGWFLAGLDLDRGATRRYPDEVDASNLDAARQAANAVASRFGVRVIEAGALERWLAEEDRTTYLFDVRTPEEFAAGSLSSAVSAQGGQLVQATDQWVGVRNARIVLFDSDGARAPVVASWLRQLGHDACVLRDGTRAAFSRELPRIGFPVDLPVLATTTSAEVAGRDSGETAVLDLRPSMSYRAGHIPGSRWSIRPRVVEDARATGARRFVLVADDKDVGRAAAIDLLEAGLSDLSLLEGGIGAWRASGLPEEATPDIPPKDQCIDFLFFAAGRHDGDREAARQYLAWEVNLVDQIDDQERRMFRLPPVAAPA